MLKRLAIAVLLMLVSVSVAARLQQTQEIKHVIYITLDGVRWQDIFPLENHFPKLRRERAVSMSVYGEPGAHALMQVASIPVSLPSYQSQMTGQVQSCLDNECGQVAMETLPEYLLSALHLKKQEVAVFSSWPVIANALESKPGTVYSNVGNLAVVDPVTNQPDQFMQKINYLQTLQHHVKQNRLDEYTFKQALHYFQKYQPAFLWISLVNADNEAHMNYRDQYNQVLSSYDDYLNDLFLALQAMQLDKTTMIIITTDHGRGEGDAWTSHGSEYPESKATWAFIMNGKLQPVSYDGVNYHYDTTSIRPTIEAALVHHPLTRK